jgi:hypothetical protein
MTRSLPAVLMTLILGSMAQADPPGIPLVREGKAVSCIVLPDQAGPVEKHAAGELAYFLEKASGARLAVRAQPSGTLYNIYLGVDPARVPLSAAMKAAATRLAPHGFLLAADKDGLRIVGRQPVGVLYGVYQVLKQYAGMRWFAPGSDFEYCPHSATIAVPEQVTLSNPSFRIRRLAMVCANVNSRTIDTWDWLVRNGMTVMLGKRLYTGELGAEAEKRGAEVGRDGGHCFSTLLSDGLFDEHPEYFPLIDGKRRKQQIKGVQGWPQPCTSNPQVAAIMARSLNKILDTPPAGVYLIGNNDDARWCQCENCLKLDPPEEKQKGFVSTRYYTLINQIAAEVYKTHPQADLWAWAYQNYQYPPRGVVPDPRLSIEAAIHGRCYRHSMADPQCPANERFREILGQWCRLKNPVSTLEYLDATVHPLYLPVEKVFAQDIKYYRKIGLAGVSIFTVPPDGVFGPLWRAPLYRESMLTMWQTYYIAAQLLWDAGAGYDAIYEDMGGKYYGSAWPAMRRYRELLTQSFLETAGHVCYGHRQYMIRKCLDKPGTEARLVGLLAEAERAAAGKPLEIERVGRDRKYFQTYWQGLAGELRAKSLPEVYAAKRTGQLAIDGRFDDPDWKKIDFTTNFLRLDGRGPADPQTFVKVLYDADNIYFAVEAMEPQVGRLKAACTRRDGPVFDDSTLEFFLAAPGMNGRYCHLALNPRGTLYDALNSAPQAAQVAFDSHAELKTAVRADRWVAEVRIPAAALGEKIQDGATWKINVARNRKVTGVPSQASSWSDGDFHNPYVYRPVVFGRTALVRNGDFEEVVKASEKIQRDSWRFQDGLAPAHWSFTGPGATAVVAGGAASGQRFYRGRGWVFQLVDLPADFRGDLKVRLMARGKGSLRVAMFQYDRDTGRHVGTVTLTQPALDAKDWTPVGAACHCRDGKVLRLAFDLQGAVDIDDVSVVPEAGADRGPRPK